MGGQTRLITTDTLAVGAVATALIWRTALIKDAEFARYQVEAQAKIAEARKAGLEAGQKASEATLAAAVANKGAAEANERAEELKASNLSLERDLIDVRTLTRGREISDEQQRLIVSGARGLKLPDLTVFFNPRDQEGQIYALSIVSVLQDIGMQGRIGMLPSNAPQMGVAFVGTGTADEQRFIDLLTRAKVVTLAANGGSGFPDLSVEQALGAPPGSIVVGLKPPGSMLRPTEAGRKRMGS